MPFYRHYSFDLWLTLIRSNPTFKMERTLYFHRHYNSLSKSVDEVALIFRQVDLMVNAINEKTGKNVDADEMYLMVISMINDFSNTFNDVDLEELYLKMEQLLLSNMPLLYAPESLIVLKSLRERYDCTVNILSNTGFIRGGTLRKVLGHLELDRWIDFQLYSDEFRLSKPSADFFRLMLKGIDQVRHPKLQLNEIIHIGDNPVADVAGAKAVGIQSLLINSNHLTISHLLS
ncbi:putative dehalogenase-hydrolase [Pedobacter sp. BAL39]|uniref:HAD family hydrolase n=1 Tax=Pedobacter sp. BAL39 TaxID=391596 RepID=UPI000155939C|nr:HAD family hydrolase [Pedobacter sp. BAL39]EDM38208.1 putative dehalogenase-hydrolase [Pedobacter sp. BAL39]